MDLQKIRLIPSHSQLSFLQIVWFLLAGCLVPHAIDAFDWNVKRRRAPELPKGSTLMSSTSCELSLKHENHWKTHVFRSMVRLREDFVLPIGCIPIDPYPLTPRTNEEFWSWIFVWQRFSFQQLLTWERNTCTQPRMLAATTNQITQKLVTWMFLSPWFLYAIAYNNIENKNSNDKNDNMYTMHI